MNKILISKQEINLLLRAIRKGHLALEPIENEDIDEHRSLRSLEDKLGSLSGEKFQVIEFIEPAEFQKQVRV